MTHFSTILRKLSQTSAISKQRTRCFADVGLQFHPIYITFAVLKENKTKTIQLNFLIMETKQKMAYEAPTIKKSQVLLDATILSASVMAENKDSVFMIDDHAVGLTL